MIRVYKDFYVEDLFDLLSNASDSNHVSSDLVNSDLAGLLYDYIESGFSEDTSEDEIYDFIRFDMEIQTKEEIKNNYEEAKESDDIEDFLSYHTTYIGNYEENDITYYVFTSF